MRLLAPDFPTREGERKMLEAPAPLATDALNLRIVPQRTVVAYDWRDDRLHAYCNDGTEFVRLEFPRGTYVWEPVSTDTIPQPE
jgi:hypothetical protein